MLEKNQEYLNLGTSYAIFDRHFLQCNTNYETNNNNTVLESQTALKNTLNSKPKKQKRWGFVQMTRLDMKKKRPFCNHGLLVRVIFISLKAAWYHS